MSDESSNNSKPENPQSLHSQPFTIICVCGSNRYAPPPYRMPTKGKGFWGSIHAHLFNWLAKNAD